MTKLQCYGIRLLGCSKQIADKPRDAFCASVIAGLAIVSIIIGGDVGKAVLIGGIAGVTMHVAATWKCVMTLPKWCYDRDVRPIVESLGYKQCGDNPLKFRVNLPRMLYFDHQDVLISNVACHTSLVGPMYVLKIIRSRLRSLD